MIAVFPQKTGDLMFVGFDSQNTSTFFNTIPMGICGSRGYLCLGSGGGRRKNFRLVI